MSKSTPDSVKFLRKLHSDVCAILLEIKQIALDVRVLKEKNSSDNEQIPSGGSEPSDPTIPSSGKQKKSYDKKQYALARLHYRLDKKAFSVAKWSAIVLALYTVVTFLMWLSNREAARAAKSAADGANKAANAADQSLKLSVLDERAWFGVSTAFLKIDRPARKGETPPYVGEPLIVRMKFSNTGRTPALNVKIYTTGIIDPIETQPETGREVPIGPLSPIKDNDPLYQLGGNVPPGGDIYRDVQIWEGALSAQNRKALSIPTHRAFVFGKGIYTDVINPHVVHWFTFCYFLQPHEPVMGVYPEWNEIGDGESK